MNTGRLHTNPLGNADAAIANLLCWFEEDA